jgi:hypothetical protein
MMMRRRRPLARAAMVGGAAYYAGKKVESGHEREAEQEARLADLESQQQAGQYQAPPPQYAPPAPAAPAAPAAMSPEAVQQLQQLAALKEQGILTQEEFDQQKRRLLGIS